MAYKQGTNPFKRTIGGVDVRDSQYRGIRSEVAARRKKRAKRVADKALSRKVEGKRVSKRQQRLMDEDQYNHDDVYNAHKARFDAMNCFAKYKSYTNTNAMRL